MRLTRLSRVVRSGRGVKVRISKRCGRRLARQKNLLGRDRSDRVAGQERRLDQGEAMPRGPGLRQGGGEAGE